jgi:hypothetical protein
VGQGGDCHRPDHGQGTHRLECPGSGKSAACELGAASQCGECLAWFEPETLETDTRLVETGAIEASEQLLGAVGCQVSPECEAEAEECRVAHD